MNWQKHKADWPMAEFSRFVASPPHRWHVQDMGSGPLLLLIHGAGGATQSWRHLAPILARHHRVIAVDLPGQGFTRAGTRQRCGLEPMAQDLARLRDAEGWRPEAIIGHSAGAAIALEMARHSSPAPPVIGINAALGHFKGLAGVLFPLMAKALTLTPFAAQLFTANAARPGSVKRLIDGTGSHLAPEDMRFYRALVSDRGHVDATLAMMAQWNLDPLLRYLPSHTAPVLLIAGTRDRAVPPKTSREVAARMPNARVEMLPDLGHLAHEEDAFAVQRAMQTFLNEILR